MKININLHGNEPLQQHGDWIDLATAEDVMMSYGQFKLIDLGVSMELPAGYWAEVAPRSSTFMNYGILMANGIGIIDNAYCGDDDIWKFPALCCRMFGTEIPKGTRIAQFRLVKCGEEVTFNPVDRLGNVNRGGFGSSGA